jgi:DNA ligase-associated metallophosphoesterase
MPSDAEIVLAGETVRLMAERALLRPATGTLYVADTHWGKAAGFRAAGLPAPEGVTGGDLSRLSSAIRRTGARRLVVLGDVLHAREGRDPRTMAAVARWRADHAGVEMVAVRGNHDRRAGDPPADWGFACVDEPHPEPPLVLRHYPEPHPGGHVLAGHLHPGVPLAGPGRQRLRLACFHVGRDVTVLPAFGGFTGTADIRPVRGDRVFVIADGEVVEVPVGG